MPKTNMSERLNATDWQSYATNHLLHKNGSIQQVVVANTIKGQIMTSVPPEEQLPTGDEVKRFGWLFAHDDVALIEGIKFGGKTRLCASANNRVIVAKGLALYNCGGVVVVVVTGRAGMPVPSITILALLEKFGEHVLASESTSAPPTTAPDGTPENDMTEEEQLARSKPAPPLPLKKKTKRVQASVQTEDAIAEAEKAIQEAESKAAAAADAAARARDLEKDAISNNTATANAPQSQAAGALAVCVKCNALIEATDVRVKTSEGKLYHRACLTCVGCGVELVDQGTFSIAERGPECDRCQIKCDLCQKNLRGEYLILADSRNCHRECAPRKPCARCRTDIDVTEASLVANERSFHHRCFVCATCGAPMTAFVEVGGGLHCPPCGQSVADAEANAAQRPGDIEDDGTGVLCDGCGQEIPVGKFVRCLDGKYHTNCLRCAQCNTLLDRNAEIYKKNDKPHCASCGKYAD